MKAWTALVVLTLSGPASADSWLDVGARVGAALPLGAFDRTTRAGDTTFGGTPLALDAAVAVDPHGRWRVELGGLLRWMPTTPRLCGSTDECLSSIGHDTEIGALARLRAPRWRWVTPEGELGFGCSWSTRQLVDSDATSTRHWSGPVVLRGAIIPTFRLGSHTRLGIVIGTALERSSHAEVEAPALSRRGLEGAAFHGTLEIGARFGLDLFTADP
jgi:hypothetical protein